MAQRLLIWVSVLAGFGLLAATFADAADEERGGLCVVALAMYMVAAGMLPSDLDPDSRWMPWIEVRLLVLLAVLAVLLLSVFLVRSLDVSPEVRIAILTPLALAALAWPFRVLARRRDGMKEARALCDELIAELLSGEADQRALVRVCAGFVESLAGPSAKGLAPASMPLAPSRVRFAIEVIGLPQDMWRGRRARSFNQKLRDEIIRVASLLDADGRREVLLEYAIFARQRMRP